MKRADISALSKAWANQQPAQKRVRIDRPREEWSIVERPELRIVDDATWALARARMNTPRQAGGARGPGGRPRTLFGGLMRCGNCGGAYVAINQLTYGCSFNKDRGASVCPAKVYISRKATDQRLLSLVRDEVLNPSLLAEMRTRIISRLTACDRACSRDAPEKRLKEIGKEISNLTQAIATIGLSDAIRARLAAAEAEQRQLQRQLRAVPMAVPAVDAIIRDHKRMLIDLGEALNSDIDRTRTLLRRALGEITIIKEGDAVYAELPPPAEQLLLVAGGGVSSSGSGVAGTGFGSRKLRIRLK